jgi:hypothetical protein
MKEVGTTHGVYGRLFGVLAWVERVIDGEVLRTGRRGESGRETLICGNDTTRGQRASEAKTCQHSSTRRLVGNRQLPTVSRLATRGKPLVPASPIRKDRLANNKEGERGETLDDPRMQQAREIERRLRDGPTRLTSQWRASEGGSLSVQQSQSAWIDSPPSTLIYQRPRSPTFLFLLTLVDINS